MTDDDSPPTDIEARVRAWLTEWDKGDDAQLWWDETAALLRDVLAQLTAAKIAANV
jgi:hypothetical protein